MSFLSTTPQSQLLESKPATKKKAFNFNANFQPTITYPATSTEPAGSAFKALPSAKLPLNGFQWPVSDHSLTSGYVVGTESQVTEPCTCSTRCIEIRTGDLATIFSIINQARGTGDLEFDPFVLTTACSARLQFFDYRKLVLFQKQTLTRYVDTGSVISIRSIFPSTEEAIFINIPWINGDTFENWTYRLAQFGDIAQMKVDKTPTGNISKLYCRYYDVRNVEKATQSTITISSVVITPTIVMLPLSFWCHCQNIHQTANNFIKTIEHPTLSFSTTSQFTGMGMAVKESEVCAPSIELPFKTGNLYSSGPNSRFNQHDSYTMTPVFAKNNQFDMKNFVLKRPYQFHGADSPVGSLPTGMCTTGLGSTVSQYFGSHSATKHSHMHNLNSSEFSVSDSSHNLSSVSSLESVSTNSSTDSISQKGVMGLFQKYSGNGYQDKNCSLSEREEELNDQRSTERAKQNSSSPTTGNLAINLQKISAGLEKRKTVMVRNIPNKLEFEDFKHFVDETNKKTYEFLYLRFDFCNRCNVGYAFISFKSAHDVKTFVEHRRGMKWSDYHYNSEKVIDIRFARIQGRDSLIQKFRNSPVMCQDPAFRPRFYFTSGHLAGKEEPFPSIK